MIDFRWEIKEKDNIMDMDYKTVDLGKKSEGYDEEVEASEKDQKVYYPRLYLSDAKLDIPTGEDVWVKMKVCKKSYTKSVDEDGTRESCELEVKEVKIPQPREKEVEFEVLIGSSLDSAVWGE